MLRNFTISLFLLVCVATSALAQQSSQSSGDSSSKTPSTSSSPKPLQADTPLYQGQEKKSDDSQAVETKSSPTYTSGLIENPVEGGTPFKHPVLIPSLSFSQSLSSGQSSIGNGTIWKGGQTAAGSLQFRWDVGRSGILAYNGTGLWTSSTSDEAQTVQQLAYSQSVRFGRWKASFSDQATYSPQSTFGFGGLQGVYGSSALGSLGGIDFPSTLVPGVEPSQTVLTTDADRVSNTTAGQLQYSLTPRSSVRVGGSYGIIRGIDTALLDGNQYSGNAGVDYRLSAANTVGLNYGYSVYSFPDSNEETKSQSAGVSFARRLSARLSSQAYVGVQITDSSRTGGSVRNVGWGASGYLNYTRTRNSVSLQFYHGASGGSGVFQGADTYSVSTSLSHALSPNSSVSVTGGYARNSSFFLTSQDTNTFFAGATANRRLGQYVSLYASYTLQQQTLGGGALTTAFNGRQHMFSLGLSWGFRPIRLGS